MFKLLIAFLTCLTLACASTETAPATNLDPELSAVAFLTGSWAKTDGNNGSEETWIAPRGGTMFGVNRTIAEGKTVFFEFLDISFDGNGIFYSSRPRGREPVSFKLIESAPNRIVFENPEHDFPQRIIYRLDGDRLQARIEGNQRGEPRSSAWVWQRVK